jgi:Protein of unknown function (Hypoth_ymh)
MRKKSEQKGFANLLKGMFGTFRNPTGHAPKIIWKIEEQDALDLLSLVSYLHRRLDPLQLCVVQQLSQRRRSILQRLMRLDGSGAAIFENSDFRDAVIPMADHAKLPIDDKEPSWLAFLHEWFRHWFPRFDNLQSTGETTSLDLLALSGHEIDLSFILRHWK